MRITLAFSICLLNISAFLTPIRSAKALSKIDILLHRMGLNSDEITNVFVELSGPTVIGMATFGGTKPFESRELMRPFNRSTKTYELNKKRPDGSSERCQFVDRWS